MSAFEDGHPLVTGPNYLGIRRFDVSRHVFPVGGQVIASMTDEQHNILRLVLVDVGFIEDFGETALEFKGGELNECCRLLLHYSPTHHPWENLSSMLSAP